MGLSVVCYVDDTWIVARGKDFSEPPRLSCAGVAFVVDRIKRLSLEVALDKSLVLLFHGTRRVPSLRGTL